MEEDEGGGGPRLSKRFSDKDGEVDYKTKAGTAWSHSYLNQKPWHPLSYPNQRRKWIAEQTHAHRDRRAEEVAREYAQEQEFFRQAAMVSKKEKEKMEMMKAVSFMYVRPPGYNAESAKAAEISDEKKQERDIPLQHPPTEGASTSVYPPEKEKRKPRQKDVFGRTVATEEQFEVLKNAPRLETGVAGRVKPFAVEVRNVKCARCGNFGHQSGDRECPLKDVIMPNEESRLKRDDPLTAIQAHTDPTEPLKWELKQKPGMSPPRGGFKPDDPNQQIVAEDIFDEYGGFLGAEIIPELLTSFSKKPKKKSSSKKSKHKRRLSPTRTKSRSREYNGSSDEGKRRSKTKKHDRSRRKHDESSSSDDSDCHRHHKRSRKKDSYSSSSVDSEPDKELRSIHRHGRDEELRNRHHRGQDKELRSRHHHGHEKQLRSKHYHGHGHRHRRTRSDSSPEC